MVAAECRDILTHLKSQANPANVAVMARYGINSRNTLGVSTVTLRRIASETGHDHVLALKLWDSDIHDARWLASIVDDPKLVTQEQMERWAVQFDSWDICDGCCQNLFGKTPLAYDKALEWSHRNEEFVKRAGFVLMARLALKSSRVPDEKLLALLPTIKREATDERVMVKKAVNWALRQIGKRNKALSLQAIEAAKEIQKIDSKAARWIAADAIRELTSEAVRKRLEKRK